MRERSQLSRASVLLVFQCCGVAAWGAPGMLESDVEEASAGFYRLTWSAEETVRLVESRSETFGASRTVYAGPDTSRVMSGKPNGDWFYRLESIASGAVVGGPTRVIVRHHPLPRALAFFGLGAAVFVATLGLIIIGDRTGRG